MKKYIVLLRGINVGGKNLLPMKALCQLLETQGYEKVSSYIQSGNIVLDAMKRPDDSLTSLIQKHFGFTPEVLVLSDAEFSSALENNPFTACEGKAVHFYFCKSAAKIDAVKLAALAVATERYEFEGKVFYLHAPEGIGRSKLAAKVESCLGVSVTARNLNTVNKLAEMMQAP